ISSPSRYQLGAATPSWLELAFTHELVHYLHLTRPRGFFGVASRVFGPLTTAGSVLFMPGWALEAPTVYAETTLTPGGRGEDPFFAMTWLAPIYEHRMYGYDQAGFPPALPPRGRIYSAGYLINDHIRRTYGDDAYHTLNDAFMRWPFLGMRRAITRATGLSADAVWWEMQRNIELRSAQRFTLPAGTPVSPPDLIAHWHLVGETERGLVAWAAGPRLPGALYLLPADAGLTLPERPDGAEPATTGGTGAWQRLLSVSPLDESSVTVDRALSRVVAAVAAPDYTGSGPRVSHSDLWLLSLGEVAVGTRTRLTTGGRLFHPALSPDGARLVAVQRRGSYARLVSVSLEDGAVTPLYAPTATRLHTPQFSPDGRYIAVVENRAGRQDVVLLSAATGEPQARVGSETHAEYDPLFSATADDGYRLTYGSDAPGRLVLREVRISDAAARGATGAGTSPIPRIHGTTIAEDPIGAFAGIYHRDTLVYATYRSTGFALRSSSGIHNRVANDAVTPGSETPSAQKPNGGDVSAAPTGSYAESRNTIVDTALSTDVLRNERYFDVPRPVFWFPLAALRAGTDRDPGVDLGVYALAASTLEQHELELTALYSPTLAQPWGSLAYRYTPGAVTWQISAERQFDSDETRENTAGDPTSGRYAVNLSAQRPLWYHRTEAGQRGLTGALGGGYSWDGEGAVNATAAARVFGARDGATGLFFGNSGAALTTQATVEQSLPAEGTPEIFSSTDAAVRWWVGRSRWYFNPEAALVTSTAGGAPDLAPYRGGGFEPDGAKPITDAEVALLGRGGVSLDLG
ncbi:MAG: hypothetical protein PF508_12990, partial [Spirochaeta sp.]|nr:hypothetical protein [Spirochaeta sp.]